MKIGDIVVTYQGEVGKITRQPFDGHSVYNWMVNVHSRLHFGGFVEMPFKETELTLLRTIPSILEKHISFSLKIFGSGFRTVELCKHIEKKLAEIRAEPQKLEEWIDVIILALDGAWRAGHSAQAIEDELDRKMEHIRDTEQPVPAQPVTNSG